MTDAPKKLMKLCMRVEWLLVKHHTFPNNNYSICYLINYYYHIIYDNNNLLSLLLFIIIIMSQ